LFQGSRAKACAVGAGQTWSLIRGARVRWKRRTYLAFILDVNSDFKPWLVERERLFDAVKSFDGDKKRGLLLIE
jgi:hypothetical protein